MIPSGDTEADLAIHSIKSSDSGRLRRSLRPHEADCGIFGEAYAACLEDIKRQYFTSTAIASMVACFAMGIIANLPVALWII